MKLEPREIKIEAEAKARAARAKEYARAFPHLNSPGSEVFQDYKWQYKQLERFERGIDCSLNGQACLLISKAPA